MGVSKIVCSISTAKAQSRVSVLFNDAFAFIRLCLSSGVSFDFFGGSMLSLKKTSLCLLFL